MAGFAKPPKAHGCALVFEHQPRNANGPPFIYGERGQFCLLQPLRPPLLAFLLMAAGAAHPAYGTACASLLWKLP